MILLVENQSDSLFAIEVMIWDTVLDIKKKIVETQLIPVQEQTLFFQGKVLEDDLYVDQCLLEHESRLQLTVSPGYIPNHSNEQGPQTQQSPLSSPDELLKNQDSDVTVSQTEEFFNFRYASLMLGGSENQFSNNKTWHGRTEEIMNRVAELIGSTINDSVLQTHQSPSPLIDEFLNNQDSDVTVPQIEKLPLKSNERFLNFQGSSLTLGRSGNSQMLQTKKQLSYNQSWGATTQKIMNPIAQLTRGSNNNPVLQTQKSPLSIPKEHIIKKNYLPVKVGRIKKNSPGILANQSPPSDSIKEIISIPDSPMKKQSKPNLGKLRVLVLPFRGKQKIPVEVNENDNIAELRKELVEMEKTSQLNLPEEGYFLIRTHRVLYDYKSFQWNGVAHGDTIEIFPKTVTYLNMGFVRQGIQTDPSQQPNSVKEISNIPYSHVKKQSKPKPGKLTVVVWPYRAHLKVDVEVNENDNIEELRKKLVEMQKITQVNLPNEGYFFKHKQRILYDQKSFQWNNVAHGDILEIVPGMLGDLGNLVFSCG